MKANQIIVYRYYKERTRQVRVVNWYSNNGYLSYKTEDDYIRSIKWDKVVSIINI